MTGSLLPALHNDLSQACVTAFLIRPCVLLCFKLYHVISVLTMQGWESVDRDLKRLWLLLHVVVALIALFSSGPPLANGSPFFQLFGRYLYTMHGQASNEAGSLLMRHVGCHLCHLFDIRHCRFEGKVRAARMTLADGSSWRIIHHQKRSTLLNSELKHPHDIWMVQASQRLSLSEELFPLSFTQSGPQHFKRCTALQVEMFSHIHLSKAALPY